MWTEAPVENWATWMCFELAVTILTPSSETALITFTPIGKLFKWALNFRGAQASLHPSESPCFQFCARTLYREAEGSVFSKVIELFGAFCGAALWLVLGFSIWTSFWARKCFFFESRKQCFLNEQKSYFQQSPFHPISLHIVPDFHSSLHLHCKQYVSCYFWLKYNWPPLLEVEQLVFFHDPNNEPANPSLVPGIDRHAYISRLNAYLLHFL